MRTAAYTVSRTDPADAREARRYDRQADRDGEAALKAYNARLEELARASEGTPRT